MRKTRKVPVRALKKKRKSVRFLDIIAEARSAIFMSPARTATAVITIIVAIAGFVTTMGLSTTLSGTVSDEFDAVRATEVLVKADQPSLAEQYATDNYQACPSIDIENARGLAGVVHAGVMGQVEGVNTQSNHIDKQRPSNVIGVDYDGLAAIAPNFISGRSFDSGADRRADNVALLPKPLADDLGVSQVGDSITVNDHSYWVLGIFDDVKRRPEAMDAIIMPISAMEPAGHLNRVTCQTIIETVSGAGVQVGGQAALALRPGAPETLTVVVPQDPKQFRARLEGPVQQMAMIMSSAILLLGLISITLSANTSVAQRIGEFGLRQSLGARPRDIASQIVFENVLLGLVGGAIGAYLGVLLTIIISAAKGWSPVLDWPVAIAAALACGLLGGLAGLGPAIHASRLDPVEALRH